MCGITGFHGKGNIETLKKMSAAISYRGPDDEGFFVKGKVSLAHRRLSIIDLSPAGHQPMANEDGSIQIVFNGEIYNFETLKRELKGKHVFKSKTDTEVIIHLYEEIGTEVFSRLEGMFSIAIYDSTKDILIIARDRMGKKPLYWAEFNNTFIFGSELKSLLLHPEIKKELNLDALSNYFLYEYVPTPQTMFKDIHKLEASHYLVWDGEKAEKKEYWKIEFNKVVTPQTFEDGLSILDSTLNDAVATRLVSDVPLGIFLSGGIDSSTMAYYAQKQSASKINTFSMGFKEASFDESEYARIVASHLGTNHHEQMVSDKDALEIIPHLYQKLDEPLADASLIPTYLLSKFTRQHVTVALGGDGGDELFCGYDTFIANKYAEKIDFLPQSFFNGLSSLANSLPTSFSNISLDFKIKKFLSGFDSNTVHRNQKWLGAFDEEQRKMLFTRDIAEVTSKTDQFEIIDAQLKSLHTSGTSEKDHDLTFAFLRTYMQDDILVKVDRASMYASLEVRAPFLDRRVVELANSMPTEWKLKGNTTKYILKKLMENKLPHDIIYRKKKGFGIPLASWLNGELSPLVAELLNEEVLTKQGIFNPSFVQKLVQEHQSEKKDNRKLLWTLIVFQIWFNNYAK